MLSTATGTSCLVDSALVRDSIYGSDAAWPARQHSQPQGVARRSHSVVSVDWRAGVTFRTQTDAALQVFVMIVAIDGSSTSSLERRCVEGCWSSLGSPLRRVISIWVAAIAPQVPVGHAGHGGLRAARNTGTFVAFVRTCTGV